MDEAFCAASFLVGLRYLPLTVKKKTPNLFVLSAGSTPPGSLLVAWTLFTPLLILDKGLDFWEAMECSRRVVTRHWWTCFALFLVQLLALAGGVLALVIGLVVAFPWTIATTVVAYEQIFSGAPRKAAEPAA